MAKGGGKSGGGGGGGAASGGGGGGGGNRSGGGSSAAAPTPAPTPAPASKPAVTSTATAKSSSSSGGGNTQDRVATLTQKAKTLIATASDGAIADPAKFKDILGKLKDLGKEKRVDTLRTQKQQAVAASVKKPEQTSVSPTESTVSTYIPPVETTLPLSSDSSGFSDVSSDGGGSTYTPSYSSASTQGTASSGPSWDSTYSSDIQKWLDEYQKEQAGRATDYTSMLTDLTSQAGKFDPDLFRSLLGELESSKKRQKEWNEFSAKAAYKY